MEELRHLFEILDTDNSGGISTEELADGYFLIFSQKATFLLGLRSQGYFLSDDEAYQLLSKVDVDKSGFIDLDEFLATLVDWSEVIQPKKNAFKGRF